MDGAAPLVAIIDDEGSVRRALSRLLRSADYRSEAFPSAAAFLASLSARVPDCLILDLQMPVMTGLDLQQRLLELDYRLPVIVITAHDDAERKDRCLSMGASHYLRKPLEGDELLGAVASAIGR